MNKLLPNPWHKEARKFLFLSKPKPICIAVCFEVGREEIDAPEAIAKEK